MNENFGDVLIYNTVREFLETKGCICDYMDVGEPCIKIIQKANEYDFLLFTGGGIIERYVPNVIRYFEEDIIKLKVADVKGTYIHIIEQKTGKKRSIKINKKLKEVIKEYKENNRRNNK